MWDGSVLCLLLLISYAWVGSCSVLSELTWTLGVGGRPLLLGVGRSADWRQKHCINKSLHFSDTKRSVNKVCTQTPTYTHGKKCEQNVHTKHPHTHTHTHMEKKCEQSRHTNTHTEISHVKQARIQTKAMTKSTHKEQSQINLTRPLPTSLVPNKQVPDPVISLLSCF